MGGGRTLMDWKEMDWKDWDEAGRPLFGHLCDGLRKFQQRVDREGIEHPNSSCIPYIEISGKVAGCDDTNHLVIQYCPFCGIKVGE